MTALGAERYVGVCFPLRARLLVTRGRVRVLIGALWGVAALSAGPVLVLVGAEPVEGNLTECRVTRWAESSGLMVAMLWLSNLYFIIPLTTLTMLYTLIARRLRQRRHVHRDHTHRQTLRMMGKHTGVRVQLILNSNYRLAQILFDCLLKCLYLHRSGITF